MNPVRRLRPQGGQFSSGGQPFAVDGTARGREHDASDARRLRRGDEPQGTDPVDSEIELGVGLGPGNADLCGQVEDRRCAPTGDRRRQIILGDVAALHLDGRIETLLPAGREVIDDEHLCTKPGKRADEMVSYEARTTRHHDPLAVVVR